MVYSRLQKSIAIFCAIAMSLALVSCNNVQKSASGGEAPTITYMLPSDPGLTFSSDTWIFKNWGEKTNVKIEVNTPPRDSFNVKIAALFASGQLPDLINYYQDAGTKFYKQYGPQFFVPLDDYIAKGKLPNYKRWLDKYEDVRLTTKHPEDGKYYAFSLIQDFDAFDIAWTIRNDILKKGGMDASEIKTIDDLKKAILTLKQASGQKYITSYRLGWKHFGDYVAKFFGTYNDMFYDNRFPTSPNQFVYGPAHPQYKVFIDFVRWMYENEILHPSFVTMEQQELFAGFSDGKFLLRMEQGTMGMMMGGQDPEKYPDREEKIIYPVAIDGVIPKVPMYLHVNNGFRYPVTVSKNSKNIDAAMRMMDWLYGDEGMRDNLYGQEGLHWVKDDSYVDGVKRIGVQSRTTDEMRKAGKMTQEQYDNLPTGNTLGGLGTYWTMSVISANNRFNLTDVTKERFASDKKFSYSVDSIKYGIDNGYAVTGDPVVDFSKEETDELANIKTTLDTYVSETSMKFISGKKPMSEWDSFVAELDKLGYKKVEEMYNKKLSAMKK